MNREESLRQSISWDEIVAIEPRIESLLRYTTWIIDPGGDYFCANEIWYNLLKPQMVKLVGWGREWHPGIMIGPVVIKNAADIMKEGRVYDLVYRKIYDALPGCRNCGCM